MTTKPRTARHGSETALVAGILQALSTRTVFAWRANAGNIVIPATHKTQRRIIRGSTPGTPDILLVTPTGRLCGLEVKTAHGVLRETQARWHERAAKFHVRTAVVRSIQAALENVDFWLRSENEP
ncbi:MAG: hypothetical protein EPO32_14725 [Anaerolineae bacterium]|nr:MAG: hypothetical protein EPO32_14725 [Anaerolineae bacterium]